MGPGPLKKAAWKWCNANEWGPSKQSDYKYYVQVSKYSVY